MKSYQALSRIFVVMALMLAAAVSVSRPSIKAQSSDLPAIVSSISPTIPPIAIAARMSGRIVVELTLDAEGKVTSANAVEGIPLLRKSAEQAVLQWRFAPSKENSRTFSLTLVYPQVSYGESAFISVLPYRMNLKVSLPEYIKPPDTVSYIPSDWRPGKDRCKVHGDILKKDKVEIVYGLIGFKEGYLESQKRLFPNANTAAYGGCVMTTDAITGEVTPKCAEVLYCRHCRIAERKWSYRNRNRKFTT
jgi:TonB family protein